MAERLADLDTARPASIMTEGGHTKRCPFLLLINYYPTEERQVYNGWYS